MTVREPPSSYLKAAIEQLQSVRGNPLSLAQREREAVELAANLLNEANRTMHHREKSTQKELSRMMQDPAGKAFTMMMTDQCFRSHKPNRVADQLVMLLNEFGIPQFFSFSKKIALLFFQIFGKPLASLLIPLVKGLIRKERCRLKKRGYLGSQQVHIFQNQIHLYFMHLLESLEN